MDNTAQDIQEIQQQLHTLNKTLHEYDEDIERFIEKDEEETLLLDIQ